MKRTGHHAWVQLDIRCARGLWFHLATGFKIIAKMLGGGSLAERSRKERPLENIGPMPNAQDHKDDAERKVPLRGSQAPLLQDPNRLLDELSKEYYAVVGIVSAFDQRLMTIKGWSVTISLAALGFGFSRSHYALFGVAAVTGVVFYIIDILTKRHQFRYYPRMRGIEKAAFELNNVKLADGKVLSAPRVDWTWSLPAEDSEPPDNPTRNRRSKRCCAECP